MTLAEFLLARIGEDEAVARAAAKENRSADWWAKDYGYEGLGVLDFESEYLDGQRTRVTDHITRHDPARVLAESEARRRIVEAHARDGEPDTEDGWWGGCAECDRKWPCATLRLLALPYADHPDYRQEWRP